MADIDIKSLGIFGPNKGMQSIKKELEEKKKTNRGVKADEEKISDKQNISKTNLTDNKELYAIKRSPTKKKRKAGAGAPVKNYDKVYNASQPIKLSALLNAITRNFTEKYATEYTKDEILRLALNEYVKRELVKEDKQELLQSVLTDLEIFRDKHPTLTQIDEEGNIIKTNEEIEAETIAYIQKSWGM